jgi:DNA-directed RNA polymerase II subunit RPB2
MVKSNICNLNKLTKEEVLKTGECVNDDGGYFIVKGKERVLVAQIRGLYNKILVLPNKNTTNKYTYVAEIRSMSAETNHSVLIQAKIGKDNRTLVFSLPFIKESIPVGIIFKAFGYLEEADIKKIIGIDTKEADKIYKFIYRDSFLIKTQEDALKYISNYTLHINKEENKIKYTWQVLETELFPHLGIVASIKHKIMLLGSMINKLISTHLGYRKEDDRDNYRNKRIESTGILCKELFRTLYKRFIKTIKQQLEKKKFTPDIISIINRTNNITSGLKYSFATGNWGLQKNSYIRTGVSQVLSRLTYGATL